MSSSKAPRGVLYVWQTVTHIEEPFELVRMLGFRRVSGETWVKSEPKADEPTEDDHIIGMGQYRRQVAEFVLIATASDSTPRHSQAGSWWCSWCWGVPERHERAIRAARPCGPLPFR